MFLPFQKSRSRHSYILASKTSNNKQRHVFRGTSARRFSAKTDTVSPQICISNPAFPVPRLRNENLIYI
ncbi:hypothetical protein N431DRAFT_436961 [Stipitochalara longipes BDJ]|nr:hypothetical protein N431DRAFT_436961 [Stipitochalara longipes BDJ]